MRPYFFAALADSTDARTEVVEGGAARRTEFAFAGSAAATSTPLPPTAVHEPVTRPTAVSAATPDGRAPENEPALHGFTDGVFTDVDDAGLPALFTFGA